MNFGIGIDLGTSFSSVGIIRNDRFEHIPNEEGDFSTPAMVAFTDTGRLIGNAAKNQLVMNPRNTVFDAHRLIGRKIFDAEIVADARHWPFEVSDNGREPVIEVQCLGENLRFRPEEVIAMILVKMKEMAEHYICETYGYHDPKVAAVITTPIYWSASQIQSIKDAASIAGLEILSIISAPICAAVAYGIDTLKKDSERTVLMYDLGGGTFGATLVVFEGGIAEVQSVAGDTHLGGEDFNNRMVYHFVNEFKKTHEKDLTTNSRALCRLRSACELAKCALSSSMKVSIDLEYLFEGIDFHTSITRARFEELCQDMFLSTRNPIDRILADARMDKSKVQEIVLVGGSTRIPGIQSILTDYFGRPPIKSLNPDYAACCGAALMASDQLGEQSCKINADFLFLDVQQISLGIKTRDGSMTKIIRRNTTIPTKKTMTFATSLSPLDYEEHGYTSSSEPLLICDIPIKVYSGERQRAKDNHMIGIINITGNPFENRRIEVVFEINGRYELKFWARWADEGPGGQKFFLENRVLHQLPEAEILRMKEVAGHLMEEDKKEAARINAKNALESEIYTLKSMINEPEISHRLDFLERKSFEASIDSHLAWLDECQWDVAEEYHSRRKILGKIVDSLQLLQLDTVLDLGSLPEVPSSHDDPAILQVPSFAPTDARAQMPNAYRTAEQRLPEPVRSGTVERDFAIFDDQSPSPGAGKSSDAWFRLFRHIVLPILPPIQRTGDRVKIAILDSGIDLNEDYVNSNRDRIKYHSFLPDGTGIEDLIGHGTHTAALLLKVAPNCEIYVARITERGSLEDTECIEKAIRYAIREWKVDIITMSFGFPALVEKLHGIQIAIKEAFVSDILMFAAARNDGGNSGIAYPANQDHVICVNSTDGYGNPSRFNPSPVLGKNLSVLGEDVLSSWPISLENKKQRRSGTSYAAPIAAAIAAIILDYSQQKIQKSDAYNISKLRSTTGMKAVMNLMSKERGGYRYLAPWELFNERRVNIYGSILDVLSSV